MKAAAKDGDANAKNGKAKEIALTPVAIDRSFSWLMKSISNIKVDKKTTKRIVPYNRNPPFKRNPAMALTTDVNAIRLYSLTDALDSPPVAVSLCDMFTIYALLGLGLSSSFSSSLSFSPESVFSFSYNTSPIF